MSAMLRRAGPVHRSTGTRMVEGDARVYVQMYPQGTPSPRLTGPPWRMTGGVHLRTIVVEEHGGPEKLMMRDVPAACGVGGAAV